MNDGPFFRGVDIARRLFPEFNVIPCEPGCAYDAEDPRNWFGGLGAAPCTCGALVKNAAILTANRAARARADAWACGEQL